MENSKESNLIWIDCEFTGIEYQEHDIVEIAVVITNKNLELVTDPIEFVVHQSDKVLDNANDWVKENIPQVLEDSRNSTISITEAEEEIMKYLDKHTEKGMSPMCGNSIGSDRHMLYYRMPKIEQWCHYRNIDVSTVKELAKFWKPEIEAGIEKKENHRALDDILESIEELKTYKKSFFKP